MELLDNIKDPSDIKKLNLSELNKLAQEIRLFLISSIASTGGHLASNLGVVELTLALHVCFNTPTDKIIWDVGHQTYIHKILTGRKNKFSTLRKLNGLSGFPKTFESPHDCFNTGHSSTSISAALGMARARDLKGENYHSIAVIGDGALTGGMAFEALNDGGRSHNNLIVILNDNEMSISKNVGALSKYLTQIRTQPIYFKVKKDIDHLLHKIPAIGGGVAKTAMRAKDTIRYMMLPGSLFEELGFTYIGPLNGHNIETLVQVLEGVKTIQGPVLVHVYTTKGKGYEFAEKSPGLFHGVPQFDIKTGQNSQKSDISYTDVFGDAMLKIAQQDEKMLAVTASMSDGTGLNTFTQKYPNRIFDVGIAEQHAVTFAAGLSISGFKPVIAIYSSFLQRAYDQILHDVALQNLHVVFAIDRAGIVGSDGETHHGIYDIAYLSHIPNITVLAPANFVELECMLRWAVLKNSSPTAVRYPRGKSQYQLPDAVECITEREQCGVCSDCVMCTKAVVLKGGKDVSIMAVGNMVATAVEAAQILERSNIEVEIINIRRVKPLDPEVILKSAKKTRRVITIEDGVVIGGCGSAIAMLLCERAPEVRVKIKGFKDGIVAHGQTDEIFKIHNLDKQSLCNDVMDIMAM